MSVQLFFLSAVLIACGGEVTASDGGADDGTIAPNDVGADVAITPCGVKPYGEFACCNGVACRGACTSDGGCTCGLALESCPAPSVCCLARSGCASEDACKASEGVDP